MIQVTPSKGHLTLPLKKYQRYTNVMVTGDKNLLILLCNRFIPNRSSTNMCRARHVIRKCNEDPSNEEAVDYQQAVADSLNTNDCPGSRILRYNAAVRDSGNVHCTTNSSVSAVKGLYKRTIPQVRTKTFRLLLKSITTDTSV